MNASNVINCLSKTFDNVKCRKAGDIGKDWYEINLEYGEKAYKFYTKEYEKTGSLARGDWLVEVTIEKGTRKLKKAIEDAVFRNKWGD